MPQGVPFFAACRAGVQDNRFFGQDIPVRDVFRLNFCYTYVIIIYLIPFLINATMIIKTEQSGRSKAVLKNKISGSGPEERKKDMEAIYWLLICVLLIGIELATMGLTTIWFAAGAFAAFIAANLGANLFIQLLVLIVVSLILLYFTRPVAVKYLNSRTVKTNVESLIGKTAVVTEDIDNVENKGQASVNGQIWMARSADDQIRFTQGEQVEILEIKGVKLIVKKYIQEV